MLLGTHKNLLAFLLALDEYSEEGLRVTLTAKNYSISQIDILVQMIEAIPDIYLY